MWRVVGWAAIATLIACSKNKSATTSSSAPGIEMHQTWDSLGGSGSLDATIRFDGHVELVTEGEHMEATIDRALVDAFTTAVANAEPSKDCDREVASEGIGTMRYTITSSGKQTTINRVNRGCFQIDGSNIDSPGLKSAEYELDHELTQLLPPHRPSWGTDTSPTATIEWSRIAEATEIRIAEIHSSTERYETVTTTMRRTKGGFAAEVTTWRPTEPETKIAKTIASKVVDDVLSALSHSTDGSCKPDPWPERGGFTATFTLTVPGGAPIQIVRRSRLCWKGNTRVLAVDATLGAATDRLMTAVHAP